MNLEELQGWLVQKSRTLGRPLSILHVGAGTGLLAPPLRSLGLQVIRRLDGVEAWPGAIEQGVNKEEFYEGWWSSPLGSIWDEIGSYDILLFDGIHPFLTKKDFLLLVQRARYHGEVLCLEGYPRVVELCPYKTHEWELKDLPLGLVGGQTISSRGFFFPKRPGGMECALILRTFTRTFLTQASLDSLLRSWIPPSHLIIIDDCTPDSRMIYLLENLKTRHRKHLLLKRTKSHNLFDTAQEAITFALGLQPPPRWLGFCDTDFVYNPGWFQEALGRYEYLRESHPGLDIRAITAFHLGQDHHFHPYQEVLDTPYGPACLRRSSGWGNLLVEWSHAQRVTRVDDRRDGGYVEDLLEGGGVIVGCVPSQVQHMGAFRSTMGVRLGDWAPDFEYYLPEGGL